MTDRLHCPACGTVLEDLEAELAHVRAMLAETKTYLQDTQMELTKTSVKLKATIRDQNKKAQEGPRKAEALDVLEFWRQTCMPKARGLNGKRLENAIARLKDGYTVEQLKRAAWGYSIMPYVVDPGRRSRTGSPADWRADAELIYREPRRVDDGLRWADMEDRRLADEYEPVGEHPVTEKLVDLIERELDTDAESHRAEAEAGANGSTAQEVSEPRQLRIVA